MAVNVLAKLAADAALRKARKSGLGKLVIFIMAMPLFLMVAISFLAGASLADSNSPGCGVTIDGTAVSAPIIGPIADQVVIGTWYGGPGDKGTPQNTPKSKSLFGHAAYAELSTNPLASSGWDFSALGGLRTGFLLRVTNPASGVTLVMEKMDVGRGGPRFPKIDLWYQAAAVLKFNSTGPLRIQAAQPGDTPSLVPIAGPPGTSPPGAVPANICGPGETNSGVPGKVIIAPGANLPGQPVQPDTLAFLAQVAGFYGKPIICTTGTNHSKFTVDGNVSDHYFGHACDFGMNANGGFDDSPVGDGIAIACLEAAGDPPALAIQEAATGGIFNRVHLGLRIQCIWRTYLGGNHHNHVHIGARPA